MDPTLPNSKAITVPVPTITLTSEDQHKTIPVTDITHFVVQDTLRVVEVDFMKPQPGERLNVFWKPARGIICQKVQEWLEYLYGQAVDGSSC
ncbi:uncharacterized protein BO80DRAFT_450116 [Aspergillus ibericus CBS 121593]|uniref:Uncharacterized protein n=1 Tax=Aspergillus ibericus CBS 121593 TaxID=1448316 RepID=A0A395GNE7_9EURO|nr:hypothetical protein BO80DRAFT_450116 [Aspergillus ibericus CBS 121593]RAK95543.1 hypothetical protein BO80DRAFT_450116 [Aspergillus ibericus CBS 121593]